MVSLVGSAGITVIPVPHASAMADGVVEEIISLGAQLSTGPLQVRIAPLPTKA